MSEGRFAINKDIYYPCCLLYSRTFIVMNVHQLYRGAKISDWFCAEYGINDIYILNRKNVERPLHVISNTRSQAY